MAELPKEKFKGLAHVRCCCGHENMIHDDLGRCYIVACMCEGYQVPFSEEEPKKRARKVKTLDSADPKLFDVETS